MNEIRESFEKIVNNQAQLNQLKKSAGNSVDYPAAPGGLRVYWNTICMHRGWKLQKNYYFSHYRILDEYNMKKAWGEESDLVSAAEALQ